jgi:hypothetical protein
LIFSEAVARRTTAQTARELARLSSDCSFLLTHLVRQKRGNQHWNNSEAKERLFSILDIKRQSEPCLRAFPVGWYGGLPNADIFNPKNFCFDGPINSN